jgi:hypothetical protein
MSFELAVEYRQPIADVKAGLEAELMAQGIHVEVCPSFSPADWSGGFLPIKLTRLPDEYLLGLPQVVQVSGFEATFSDISAHLRTTMGRTIAELILQCHSAAALAVLSKGVYHDLQTSEAVPADSAVARARQEVFAYVPHLNDEAKTQHPFTQWRDYTG